MFVLRHGSRNIDGVYLKSPAKNKFEMFIKKKKKKKTS